MKRSRAAALACTSFLALLAFPIDALAQPTPPGEGAAAPRIDPLRLAEAMTEGGRPDLACPLLEQVFGADTDNLTALALMGDCRNALGDRGEAKRLYERVLEAQPDAERVRARLAGIYLAEGDRGAARSVLTAAETVRPGAQSSKLMSSLARSIPVDEPLLASVDKPKRLALQLSAGLIVDSNVNGGPSSSTAAAVIGGLPVTLAISDESMPRDDGGVNYALNANYLRPLSKRWALLFQGNASAVNYFDETHYDRDSVAGGVALLYRGTGFTVSIQPNAGLYRQDRDREQSLYGVSSRATVRLSPKVNLSATASVAHRDVAVTDARNSDEGQFGLGISYSYRPGIRFGAQYDVLRADAGDDVYSYWAHGPQVYASAGFARYFVATLRYRYNRIDYDERYWLFPEKRKDDLNQVSANLDIDLSSWTVKGLGAYLRYDYRSNASTVELNQAHRHQASSGLFWRF